MKTETRSKKSNMWVEVEVILENTMLKEMNITSETAVRMMINTEDIEAFREVIDDEGTVIDDEIMLYLKRTGSYLAKYNYNTFKTIINASKTI